MKLDLGCGNNKHPGFFGIDRLPFAEADKIWDLDEGIPLPDNCAEWVMACRVLPYVKDLFAVMSEIYRVSVHRGIVCILAPYAHSFRHVSNPLLRHKFDEHTPRYLTEHFYQPPLCPASPPVPHYYSNTGVPFDFRLLRMELFYNEAFRSPLYDPEELEFLLAIQPNVADEIMYYFVAAKEEMKEPELEYLSRQTYMEPLAVAELGRIPWSPPDMADRAELPLLHQEEAPSKASAVQALSLGLPRGHRKKGKQLARASKKRPRRHR